MTNLKFFTIEVRDRYEFLVLAEDFDKAVDFIRPEFRVTLDPEDVKLVDSGEIRAGIVSES